MDTSSFGPGRLDRTWLESPSHKTDPWILETTNPYDSGHRDAFLGNGFIGQRISVEGDCKSHPLEMEFAHPKCLVHGLWSEIQLMAPPKWAILSYNDGLDTFAIGTGEWRNYRQRLNMKKAMLETTVDWVNKNQITQIYSLFYLSRTRTHIGILKRVIRPNFKGLVSISDSLEGTHIQDACDWRIHSTPKSTDSLGMELTMGPRKRRIALASKLVAHQINLHQTTIQSDEKNIHRTFTFQVEAGKSYEVTKIVALVTDHDAPSPWLHSKVLVEAAASKISLLENEHCNEWSSLWKNHIEVPHPHLQCLINTSLYQLYSQLKKGGRSSLGPTGLSSKDWGGRVFWDSDLWMFPVMALLNPELSKGFVDYRYDTLQGASRNARAEGYKGAMYPWESSEFGDETIPELVYHHQHHVNSDIALSQWWYWKITSDESFYRNQAAPIIIESAHFWASRSFYNKEKDRYEIKAVCCADELAEIRDNNSYTNYSVVKNLELAIEACQKLNLEIPPIWSDMISKMWIPFDSDHQRYIEYEGYQGETIKQADTALLIYPYGLPMSDFIKTNTIDYYRAKYPPEKIMMASAFDGIVDCELGRSEHAWEALCELTPHFRFPYLLVSESPANEIISFATGLGGFLQLIVMGFAGLRIGDKGLIVNPCLPPQIEQIKISGIHYDGVSFDLTVKNEKVTIENPSDSISFSIKNREGFKWI
ncbi:MAG: glycosyl hydrolase family 65 protein [Verrucomicrobiota bacterium]